MDATKPETWPHDFKALETNPPNGWKIYRTVLDPILIIKNIQDNYKTLLCARLHRKNGGVFLTSPSLKCNWVCGENVIFPLPSDVSSLLSEGAGNLDLEKLTFSQALSLQRSGFNEIEVLLDQEILVSANDQAKNFKDRIAIPGLNATLYDYQSKGISWMQDAVRRTGGVVLADEMGLGKTLQIIGLLLLNHPTHKSPALVLCPTSLIVNWLREINRFAPCFDAIVHRGPDRARLHHKLQSAHIVITTYETLVNDLVLFKAIEWSWLICDEAQAIKNPDSQRRIAVSSIPRTRTIPVTGTPVENHLLDLWSLLDIAIPGLLGSRKMFEELFQDTENSARILAAATNPFILKRHIKDVAQDLPKRIDIKVPIELSQKLAIDYEKVRLRTLEQYPTAGALVATGQLQLFCAHPLLTSENTPDTESETKFLANTTIRADLETPKVERTIELLEEAFANGKKVLLFANYNACGAIIKSAAKSLPPAFWGFINGSTAAMERQTIVDNFSAHNGPGILILNPRAAGTGLNITAATIVIHYTQVWNPALEQQASARAYRRGQENIVTVYYLFYIDTIEEVMMERAHKRRELGAEAVPSTKEENKDLRRALAISPVSKQ